MAERGVSADAFWLVMVAVLTVIGLILLLPIISETKNISEDLTDYHLCKDGNLAMVKSRVEFLNYVAAEGGMKHCRTERLKISKGKEYETIAKKMTQCWDMYLQGREAVFETKDANYCAFCSVLEFEEKGKSLNELTSYLADNYLPSTKMKYIKYLTEIEVTDNNKKEFQNFDLNNNLLFDTSKNLAVMFVMYKDAYPGLINQPSALTAWGGTAVATTAGFIITGVSYVAGLGLCSTLVGCSAGIILIGSVGGVSGYLIGSDRSADWRAKIMLTEYEQNKLEQLKCTRLEGLDYLKIQKK